jgi:hypothetical protein
MVRAHLWRLAELTKETAPEDAFIREVDEEYRREQMATFWSRYGRWILIAVGLLLIALAAFLWWREEQAKERGQWSEQFAQAMQGLELGDAKAKATIERFATGDYGGYTVLAKFKTASQAEDNGDTAGATKIYDAIAADGSVPEPFQQLATLKSIRLNYDSAKPADLIEKLRPLGQPGGPWFGVAGEMLAVAYMRDGKNELAGPIFSAIAADDTLPPSLRQRAQQMAAALGAISIPELGAKRGATPAPAPAPAQPEPASKQEKK